ncbi:MAG: inverse autotransporter beta domain-containing protein [Roseitalea porphyridii]|uniref:inverse autotransporter beta domain-containing protein n=1 Tax=Roseitalea porphyridii TaxID=1852022 RepID=UPI0032D9A0F7
MRSDGCDQAADARPLDHHVRRPADPRIRATLPRLTTTASLTAIAFATGAISGRANDAVTGVLPVSADDDPHLAAPGSTVTMVAVGADNTHDYLLDLGGSGAETIDRRIAAAFGDGNEATRLPPPPAERPARQDTAPGADAKHAQDGAPRQWTYALQSQARIVSAFSPDRGPLAIEPKWGPFIDFIARPGSPYSSGTIDVFAPLFQADDWLLYINAGGTLSTLPSQQGSIGGGYRQIVPDFLFGEDTILGVYGFVDFLNTKNNNNFVQGTIGAELLTENFEFRINGYLPGSRTYDVGGVSAGAVALQGTNVILSGTQRREQALPGFDVDVGLRFELDPDTAFRVGGGYYRFERGASKVEGGRLRAEVAFDDPFGFDGATLAVGGELTHDNQYGTQGNATIRFRMPLGSNRTYGDEGGASDGIDGLMVRPVNRFQNIVAPEFDVPVENAGPLTDAATGQTLQVYHVAQTAQGTGDCSSAQNACTFTVAQSLAGAGDTFLAVDIAGDIADVFALTADRQRVVGAGDAGTVSVPLTDALNSVLTLGGLGGRPTVAGVNLGATDSPYLAGIATNGAAGIGGNGFTGTATIMDVRTTGGGLALQNSAASVNVSGSRFDGGAGFGVSLTNLGGAFTMTGSTVTGSGGGVRIEGGNGAISHDGAITQTGAASAVDIRNRTGGSVTLGGPVTANTGAATAVNLQNNAGTIAFGGNLDIDTTTGTGIDLNGNTGPVSFGAMTQIDVAGAGTGVDFQGTTGGAVGFADLDIALSGANGTAFDLAGATINANVTATDFDVSSTTNVGTTGIDLSGTTGPGTIRLGDMDVAGQSASIAGVDVGVRFSAASNATFVFGDGESPTDRASTISGTTAIANGSAATNGSYDFDDVAFTGTLDFTAAGGGDLVFVAATATGDGSGSDVDNRANVITADAIVAANTTFVLINDGAAIDDVDGFTLSNDQTMASFGNGRTFASAGLIIPASFSGVPGGGAAITDPTGNGAAVLTNTGAGDTLTALGAVTTQDFIIENAAGGDGLAGTGAIGVTLTGLTIRNITAGQGIDLDNVTGTVTLNDTTVATTVGNGVDIANSTVSFTGDLDIDTTTGTGLNVTGGSTVGVAAAGMQTIDSTAGVALDMAIATIGAGGINLDTVSGTGGTRAINLTGVTTSAGNGINIGRATALNNTVQGIAIDDVTGAGGVTIVAADIDNPANSGIGITGTNTGATFNIGTGTSGGLTGLNIDGGTIGLFLNQNGGNLNIGTGTGFVRIGETTAPTVAGIDIDGAAAGEALTIGNATNASRINSAGRGIDISGRATLAVTNLDITNAGTEGVHFGNFGGTGTFDDLTIQGIGGASNAVNIAQAIEASMLTFNDLAIGGFDGGATGGGIVANVSGTGSTNITFGGATNTITAPGAAIDVDNTSGNAASVVLALDNLALTRATAGFTLDVDGGATDGATVVTSLNGLTIIGNGTSGGALFDRVTFDADTGTAGIQQVTGTGTTQIGQGVGARVVGDGLSLLVPTGDLALGTVDIFNTGGTGLEVDTKTGGPTVFTLGTTGGTVDTVGGPALFLDPLTTAMTLDAVTSTNSAAALGATGAGASGNGTGITLDQVSGTFTVTGTTTITGAADDAILLTGNAGTIGFGTVAIAMGTGAGTAGIDVEGANGAITFGTTTITAVGGAANQTGIDLSGAMLNGTVAFQSAAISGPDTSTTSIGIDLTGVTGNQLVNIGEQVAAGASSSITDLHRGVVIDNTAAVQFTFGDGESPTDTGSSISVNGQAGAFTVDLAGGTLAASSFDFNDVAFTGSANLPGAAGSAVFVSETGGAIANGTHGLNLSTGGSLNTITVAAAEALGDTDQTFVFVAHDGTGRIDVTGGGADGFTLKDGQSLDGFDDGRVITFGTVQPANVEGNLGATGGTVTQDTVIASNSAGGATSIVATAAGAGNSTIRNTVFDGAGLGAGDAAISVSGAANAVTINNVEITNVGAGATAVLLNNNAGGVTLTDVDLTNEVAGNAGTALGIDAGTGSTAAITVDAASDIDGTSGTVVSIGAGARNVTIDSAIAATGNGENVIDIAGQSAGTIQFGAVSSANATGDSVIEVTGQSGGTLSFGNVAITGYGNAGTDTAIELAGSGGTATFTDVDIATTNGAGFSATGAGLTVGANSGDISAAGGAAVNLTGVRALNFALTSVTGNGGGAVGNGVVLDNLGANSGFSVAGATTLDNYTGFGVSIANLAQNGQTLAFGAVNINTTVGQVAPGGDGIGIDTVSATGTDIDFGAVTIGNATNASGTGIAIADITNAATGFDLDFGSLSLNNLSLGLVVDNFDAPGASTVTVAGTTGITANQFDAIRIINSDGDVTFSGRTTIVNSGAAAGADGIDLGTSAGGANTGSYTFNGLDVTVNGANAFGFRATDSGTVTINDPGGNNQITSNNGTAVFINPTVANITLQNVTSTNATGSGVDLTLATGSTFTVTGTTAVTGSDQAGVEITNSGGSTVSLGALTIDNDGAAADGAGLVVNQGAAGTLNLNVTTGTIASGNDEAINLFNTSTGGIALGVTLTSVSVNGAAEGINIVRTSGSISGSLNTGAGGSITGTTTRAINVNGGTETVTIGQSVTTAGGEAVRVSNKTGGSFTLSGNISHAGGGQGVVVSNTSGGTVTTFSGTSKVINGGTTNGVNLSGNTGATINFTGGGLDIDTTSGAGFSATGGGTVTVQGTGNSVTSTTGTAVTINDTTIGAAGVTFQSVSANGGTNGIYLRNTGSSGFFAITGTGSTDGSGGTIQNITGANVADETLSATGQGMGIYLENVDDIRLSNLRINNTSNFALRGFTVNDLQMTNVDLQGFHGDDKVPDEGGVYINDLTGTAAIAGGTYRGGIEDSINIDNDGITGALNLTISGATITTGDGANNAIGNNGITIQADGGTVTALVQNNTFTAAVASHVQVVSAGTANFTAMTIDSNEFLRHTGIVGNGGIGVLAGASGSGTFNVTVSNNDMDSLGSLNNAIDFDTIASFTGTVDATIDGNTIGTGGAAGSGASFNAIDIAGGGNGSSTYRVINNQIFDHDQRGIDVTVGEGNHQMTLVLTNNLVQDNVSVNDIQGIHVDSGTTAVDTPNICATITGNTVTANGNYIHSIRVRTRNSGTMQINNGTVGAATTAAVETHLSGNNTFANAVNATQSGGPFTFVNGCP